MGNILKISFRRLRFLFEKYTLWQEFRKDLHLENLGKLFSPFSDFFNKRKYNTATLQQFTLKPK